jgi:hypothetical protein
LKTHYGTAGVHWKFGQSLFALESSDWLHLSFASIIYSLWTLFCNTWTCLKHLQFSTSCNCVVSRHVRTFCGWERVRTILKLPFYNLQSYHLLWYRAFVTTRIRSLDLEVHRSHSNGFTSEFWGQELASEHSTHFLLKPRIISSYTRHKH